MEIGAFGHVLHTDTVVPLAFIVDRHDGQVAERVRSAEQQPRRRHEIPAVAADIVLPRRRIEIILIVFRFIIDQVRFDVGTVTAVEPVVGRSVERHTHAQAGHGAHDDTQFEIHAAAVDLRFLIEAHVIELRIERGTVLIDRRGRMAVGIEITVLFLIGHAHLLVDAAYADRGSDIDDVVEIGPHRNGEFVDRALAHDIHRVHHRSVTANAVGHPLPAYVADQVAIIAENGRPVPGIPVISQIALIIGENTILPELLPEDIGDGRHQLVGLRRVVTRLRGERIAGIEIRDTVHADTERKARERAGRTLENIERHTDVGKSEAGLVIAHPRRRALRLAMGDRQQRCERELVAAVHAQPGRVDRHRRKVGAQRSESPAHPHHARRTERMRSGKRGEIGRHHQVIVVRQSPEFEVLGLQRRCGHTGRKQYYDLTFHTLSLFYR